MTKKHLFICGTPRSGTTAMLRFVNADSRFALGVERYGTRFFQHKLTPDLFEPERFARIEKGDTFYDDLDKFSPLYARILARMPDATYVGDKIPMLYRKLDWLLESIPDAKVIVMVRNIFDIAASYEERANNLADASWDRKRRTAEAIRDWNETMVALKRKAGNKQVYPVMYEDFFFHPDRFLPLCEFLEVKPSRPMAIAHQMARKRSAELDSARRRDLSTEDVLKICRDAPFGMYRRTLASMTEHQTISPGDHFDLAQEAVPPEVVNIER